MRFFWYGLGIALLVLVFLLPEWSVARNIAQYSDTISTSVPGRSANHTLNFTSLVTIPPEGMIVITPPPDFTIPVTSTFSSLRNVEVLVNGLARSVGSVLSSTEDYVTITPGTPGQITYQLNQSEAIPANSQVTLRIGNKTTNSQVLTEVFSTTTGTTTIPADQPPIINPLTPGTYEVDMRILDAAAVEIANAGFLIAIIEPVGVGPIDTREFIPPLRFNGQPTSTVGGTTPNVEISLETDEFATCRYSRSAGVDFSAMTLQFTNTSLIFHSNIVPVSPNTQQDFYVRCRDDEGNVNLDDYLISFFVSSRPTGSSSEDGNGSGSGTGSGNGGSGSGSGTGDTGGGATGGGSTQGSSGGGSGGGGGGGGGGGSGSGSGGGFESSPGPFRSGDGQVVITGLASPRARITALVDGRIAANATADSQGEYSVTIDRIARGAYTFGIYATDVANTKSSTFSTTFTVSGARASALSNVNIPPSILVTPNPVNPGQTVTFSGYTIPNATVTLENERDRSTASRRTLTATANGSGAFTTTLDTTGFTAGTYKLKAKAAAGETTTNFSQPTLYGVGQAARTGSNADLSRDGRVNLTDFSILLFWWNTNGGDSEPPADISQDGRVNLTDFSILLFNWSG